MLIQLEPKVQRALAVTLNTNEGLIPVYYTELSGRVISRKKINTVFGVDHTGIILGEDSFGRLWIAHNHYKHKRALYEIYDGYLQGNVPELDNRLVNYNPQTIITRTINEVSKGTQYHAITYNCQTFVNLIVRDEHSTEGVDKVCNVLTILGAFLALWGVFSKNKALMYTGVGIAGVSAGAKFVSKSR